jgi:uncharacterized protein
MERIGTVETISRYSVKSMAGEKVALAFVGFAGLMGDRAFAFVRTAGPKGFPWHTGRKQEDLVLFRPHFREGGAATLPPDIEETFKMRPASIRYFPPRVPSRSTSQHRMAGPCRCARPSSKP